MHRIFIFRHGQTDWNAQERFQGHVDIPLNDTGREQARNLAPVLQGKGLEAILSSDLSRAHETACILAQGLGLQVYTNPGLREAHLGDAQGLTRKEIEEKFGPELVKKWKSWKVTDADISYPGGETGTQVLDRVVNAIHQFLLTHPYKKIGVSTHGGVIRRLMQQVLPPGSPPVPIPNGVVYELEWDLIERKYFVPEGVVLPKRQEN